MLRSLMIGMILFAQPAAASYHCRHGLIYRVRMGVCVGENSRLAKLVFNHHRHHPRLASLTPAHRSHQKAQDGQTPRPATVSASTTPPPVSEAATTPELPDPFHHSVMAHPVTPSWRIR